MAKVFDALKPFSFGGIPFPYQSFSVRGGIRDHVHEYPHAAGGAPEKLGRKLYEIQVSANLQAALITSNPQYKTLWPNSALGLRSLFEDQVTGDLHIPTIGTIKAYAVSWEERADANNRSGVSIDLSFREDQEAAFLVDSLVEVGTGAISQMVTDWTVAIENTTPAKPSIFDQITNAANTVLAIKDQVDLYGTLVESKILGLTALIREADRQVVELNDPNNYQVLDALHALWQATNKLNADILQRNAELLEFITPIQMPIQMVANSVYGASTRASEIMQLNAIEDPLLIPAGTRLRYYAAAA